MNCVDRMRIRREMFAALILALLFVNTSTASEPGLDTPFRSVRDVVYRQVSGVELKADIFRPDHDRPCPSVLMIHGGAWSSGDKWNVHDHARELAQAGYVAVAINYRLAPFHQIQAQVADCRAALKWLQENAPAYNADVERIGLWGYSAGAHLACLIAAKPERSAPAISVVVAGGAPCDFSHIPEDSYVLALVMGGTRRQKAEVYHDVAPLHFASPKCPPTFFFHGTQDFIVPISTSRKMESKLRECGVETEYCELEGQGHFSAFVSATARRRAISFMNKHLQADH
jgi:acetyl esterase/lipase